MDQLASSFWTVESSEDGVRLDLFLSRRMGIGRSGVRRLVAAGRVRRDDRPERAKGRILRAGERVEVVGAAGRLVPQPEMPLSILNQGPGWVIVDLPAAMAVHPLREGERGTMLNALAARFAGLEKIGEGGLRGGVVHRLDVQTSGALLVATEQAAWERLREAFRRHEVHKIYHALVEGRPADSGRLEMDLSIGRHKPARVRADVAGTGGKGSRRCDLEWRVLERFPRSALVEVRLGTGFLHQIRVMFAAMGHPVLGDTTYGSPVPAYPRQMLHAHQLTIIEQKGVSPHIGDQEKGVSPHIEGVSPWPEDFSRAVEDQRRMNP